MISKVKKQLADAIENGHTGIADKLVHILIEMNKYPELFEEEKCGRPVSNNVYNITVKANLDAEEFKKQLNK